MGSTESDSELIARSLIDGEAFAEIFDRHFNGISVFLRRRIDQGIADELTAETFLIAFRGRHAFDTTRASAKPWLIGIATNLLRREHRGEARRLRAYARLDREPEPDIADEAVSRGHAESKRANLVEAVLSLSADEKHVLLLFAWADLSYEEIAEALEIPIGTVRSRLARARKHMQELVDVNGQERKGVSAHG
jgi:RNA polymerase sigma-70 factor (ECF subfamily)